MRRGHKDSVGLCEVCRRKPAELKVFMPCGSRASSGERHLCAACARDDELILCGDRGLLLTELVHTLICAAGDERNRTKVCPGCGNTLEEMRSTGMLGCSICYMVFQEQVDNMIDQLHGYSPGYSRPA